MSCTAFPGAQLYPTRRISRSGTLGFPAFEAELWIDQSILCCSWWKKIAWRRFESLVWLTVNVAQIVSIQFRIKYLSAYLVLILSAYSLVSCFLAKLYPATFDKARTGHYGAYNKNWILSGTSKMALRENHRCQRELWMGRGITRRPYRSSWGLFGGLCSSIRRDGCQVSISD